MPLGLSDNLFKRIVSALALLPVVLGFIYLGGWWFYGLLAVGGWLMFREWCTLTGVKSPSVVFTGSAFIIGLTALLTYFVDNFNVAPLAFVAMQAPVFLCNQPRKLAKNTITTSSNDNAYVGASYVLLALVSLTWLRNTDDNGLTVIWLFFAVWAMDVGGYFAGKGIGGPKLAPKLSPKKTWAGLVGGMVLAAIVSVVISIAFGLGSPIWMALAGALVAVVAQLGDLYESAVKRALNAKDSGNLIPGHGGILDRVDGLVFAAPAVALAMAVPLLSKVSG